MPNNNIAIDIQDLCVKFPVAHNWMGKAVKFAHALNNIDLQINYGETFGIVGESGCGKSTLANVLMQLIQPSSGTYKRLSMQDGKPANIQIVFQDPQSSLDPRLCAWQVITEPVVVQQKIKDKKVLRQMADDLALKVGLRSEQMSRYIHEFSGGQRQRIAIARALSSNPDVILLDEPTSALDISVQAQILNLLMDLRAELGLTYILISHNVSVIKHLCDRVAVMYLGQIIEQGSVTDVLDTPKHPYTKELLSSVPRLDTLWSKNLEIHNKELPSNRKLPTGCFYKDRCSIATNGCENPQTLQSHVNNPEHKTRCHVAHRN